MTKILDNQGDQHTDSPAPYLKEAEPVKIEIPANYVELVDGQIRDYKKWLRENQILQLKADEAETDEEMEAALKECTAHFKKRYAGIVAKDQGERLAPSKIRHIWNNFMRYEYRAFIAAHKNLTIQQLLYIGIDKFIYTMGWKKPSDSASWRKNKVRIGVCCHCKDQFIPLMFQHNHGLCMNCRPLYSVIAIRNYILRNLDSPRYENAHHDLLMDFYIMFYHDEMLRKMFIKGTETANQLEEWKISD